MIRFRGYPLESEVTVLAGQLQLKGVLLMNKDLV